MSKCETLIEAVYLLNKAIKAIDTNARFEIAIPRVTREMIQNEFDGEVNNHKVRLEVDRESQFGKIKSIRGIPLTTIQSQDGY